MINTQNTTGQDQEVKLLGALGLACRAVTVGGAYQSRKYQQQKKRH